MDSQPMSDLETDLVNKGWMAPVAPDGLDPDTATPDEILQRESEQEEAESDEKDRIVADTED